MARTRAMRMRNPSLAAGQFPLGRQSSICSPVRKKTKCTRSPIHRINSLRRKEKALEPRSIPSKRRQPLIPQPAPKKYGNVALNHRGLSRQLVIRQAEPASSQPVAANASAPLAQSPIQVERPAVRLKSLERPISPPPLRRDLKRKRQPLRCTATICRGSSPAQTPANPPPDVRAAARINHNESLALRTPIIRRQAALAWAAQEEPTPSSREVARIIHRERNLPRIMVGMNDKERRVVHAALEDGTIPPHEFSPSQLAWAGIIARAKPTGMDMVCKFFSSFSIISTRKVDKLTP